MNATQFSSASLAGRRTHLRFEPRVQLRRRLMALVELFQEATRKPAALYALTRRDPRCKLPDEKHRAMIHEGIKAGVIPTHRVAHYRLFQLRDDLAQYTTPAPVEQVTFTELTKDESEAFEAQAKATLAPTVENRVAAIEETEREIAAAALWCAAQRAALPDHPLPMGAPR